MGTTVAPISWRKSQTVLRGFTSAARWLVTWMAARCEPGACQMEAALHAAFGRLKGRARQHHAETCAVREEYFAAHSGQSAAADGVRGWAWAGENKGDRKDDGTAIAAPRQLESQP